MTIDADSVVLGPVGVERRRHELVDESLVQVEPLVPPRHPHGGVDNVLIETKVGVAVTVIGAGNALRSVRRIPDKERGAVAAVRTHGVVLAIQTGVQLVGTGAIGVTVAKTGLSTLRTDEGKIALALVGFDASPVQAATLAHRLALTTGIAPVSGGTFAPEGQKFFHTSSLATKISGLTLPTN